MQLHHHILALALALSTIVAQAETIRVAIGTQDTTINCATGGLLIRELKLLEKYLPHDGKYKNVQYEIEWKNFTSGAPLTNEMVAGKLDLGSLADFPGSFNGAAFQKAGKQSHFITVLSGSTLGSGNGIVVPKGSPVQALSELKGKTISVPFASTAHGMLLRAVKAQGWDPEKDVNIVTQAPEVKFFHWMSYCASLYFPSCGKYFSSSFNSRIKSPPVAQLMVVSWVPMAMRMVSAWAGPSRTAPASAASKMRCSDMVVLR